MRTRAVDTRWLTHASFEPIARQQDRQRRLLAGVAVLLLLAATGSGLFGDLLVNPLDLAAARKQQAVMTAEVERLRTQLAVERATRADLEQNAAALNTQVVELTRQVEFLTARRPGGARPN